MASRDGFVADYDPVTPRRPRAADEGEADRPARRRDEAGPRDETEFGRRVSAATPERTSSESSRRERKPEPERWSARRGHAAAYVGLFVFTFVLYYRPYEQIAALAWFTQMAFVVAVATLVVFFPAQISLEGTLTARPREVNLLLLLCLTALLSMPLAISPGEAWETFTDSFLKAVVIFVVMVNVLRTRARLKGIIFLSLAVSAYLSVSALNDYRSGNLTVEGYRVEGAIGNLFGNPNDMAIHLVTMLPIAIVLAVASRNPVKKLLYGLCSLLVVVGTVLTYSRGGFLGLLTVGAVLGWKLGRRNRLLVVIAGLACVALFFALAPGNYVLRILSIFDHSLDPVSSASSRQALLERSIITSLANPVFGIGMGNFHIVSIKELVSHNSYTQVSAEMGLTALVIYVLFIVTPLRRLARVERETLVAKGRPTEFYYLSVGLQASLVCYMVVSFFGSVAYLWYVYYLVAYAVALRRLYAVETNGGVFEFGKTPKPAAKRVGTSGGVETPAAGVSS
ncbi:MAG TPA: O-antigen ligase family protein [Pyrinomonadaceae bacterium]|nr:O-antigen ligase family protein [Pyrinomonadaceae bacterium]